MIQTEQTRAFSFLYRCLDYLFYHTTFRSRAHPLYYQRVLCLLVTVFLMLLINVFSQWLNWVVEELPDGYVAEFVAYASAVLQLGSVFWCSWYFLSRMMLLFGLTRELNRSRWIAAIFILMLTTYAVHITNGDWSILIGMQLVWAYSCLRPSAFGELSSRS